MWILKILFLLLAGFAWSSVLSNFQCARFCKEENGSFGYEAGKAYTYKYSGSARSLINTSTIYNVPDQSEVNIHCTVVFRLLSNCDYVMEILEATISDSHIKNSFKTSSTNEKFHHLETALKERPLHFAFNGKIDTICPEKGELKEIIDIKRGILSVFQNSNPQFKPNTLVYETDITGNCETLYTVTTTNEGTQNVNKTKNLDACDHRMSQYLSWQTVPYMTNANSKSLPLLKSSLNCQMNYGTSNILYESTCNEKHVFQPFSNGDNGAVTIIQQEMKFVTAQTSYKVFNGPKEFKRSTLIYEYNSDNLQLKDSMAAVMLLKELESKTADGVDMDVPSVFSKLVLEFQGLSKNSLLEIFNKLNQKQRKFYIDAISLITTTAGIEVMSELYETKKLDDAQMNTWLLSVNFIKNPSKSMLKIIYPMILIPNIRRNAMLSFSSILYKYCNKQSNCLDDVVILDMVKNLEKPLINNCLITSEYAKKEIFLTLKSIGNAGITTSFYNLQNCYLNNELPIEIRLAAIAAHRRIKCTENENLDDFKALFANSRANSEIRIASYLASMQCASYATFAQVKDVLFKEEANQVGSFIWTHLTNLQETSVPWKQGIKKLLENEFLQNKFRTDIRKYSRNYEASTFFDSFGAGGGIEANVIFSSESYLPRSLMLNFTMDLFGETINLLELGARAEGFEDIVENLFANEGYLQDTNLQTSSQQNHPKQQRIDEFGEVFKVLPRDPSGSIYAKIFGNELSFTQFNNLQDLFGMPNSGKEAIDILMKFIKQTDIDYTKSFSFLDANYKIPTIIGFPMQLKANGTATVGLTAGGEINFKDLRNYKMLIKGKIYPSVSVQVTSTMSMDTYTDETGIQYIGLLKSNMYIDGYANMEMGKIVDIKINVPKKQMDIFTVSSDLYVIHDKNSYPIQDSSTNVDNSEYCTASYVSKLTGLQFCNQWRFVNASSTVNTPNFPLTGSFKYSMHIKKTDTFDFFQFYLETQLTNPEGQYLINFVVDTPQSKIDRKLQCLLTADLKDYQVNAQIYSPFVNFQLQSRIEGDMPKYKFTLTTLFNNKEVVGLLSTFDVRNEGEMVTYEPFAKINFKQQQIVSVTGKLSHVKGGEYTADLKLEGLTKEVAQIFGSFNCGSDLLQLKTNILSSHFKGNLDAILNAKPNNITFDSVLNYNYQDNVPENISFSGKFNKDVIDSVFRNMLTMDLKASEWPTYNSYFNWINQRGPLYFNNSAELVFFDTTWTSRQIIKLDKGFQDEEPDLILLADLSCPENNIDYKSEISFNASKNHLRTKVLFQLNEVQRAEAFINYNSKSTEDTLHILFYYVQQTWTIDGEINKHSHGIGTYNFDVDCRYKSFDQEHVILTIHGNYKNASLGDVQNHKLNCTIDLPESGGEWRTPWIVSSTIQKSHATFLSQSKLTTKEADYAGYFNWIEDALAISIQANDKPLFVVNGALTEEFANVALALNIHQHFEVNAKLVLPYQRFDLQVYWDKDRDENQRFTFSIEHNAYRGQYKMEIEYPNQKIITDILLIPTEVTMNVTWGVEVSRKIYLKVGTTYYDVGTSWFGELETPFRYLEKQKFHLQYAVVTDSFDVQSELSWRTHNINLLISGSKSNTHLNGNLQLNTTLPEIRKVGVTLSHTHHTADNDYRSDAAFDYNDHSIRAQSNWRMTGYRVDSNFRVDSPTQTISPIFGILTLNDDENGEDVNDMHFILSWLEKNITASYAFKSDASSIEIDTPFEGIEKTLLKYSVVTHAETVFLSTVIDIFKQNNSITFSWTNTDEVTTFWLDLMSPMTGRYYGYFTHSGLLTDLKENFKIQGPDDKDIIQFKIEGAIMPVLNMNFTASLVLLDHDAQLSICNSREPIVSNIVAVWNERTINSQMSLNFKDSSINFFEWLIESNLFAPVNVSYNGNDLESVTIVNLPNDYKLINRYTYSKHLYELNFQTPNIDIVFNQVFMLKTNDCNINQELIAKLGDQKIYYTFKSLVEDYSSLDFNLSYNFFQQEEILSSYNVTTQLKRNLLFDLVNFTIASTSPLNGKLVLKYIKGAQLTDIAFFAIAEYNDQLAYQFIGRQRFIIFENKLNNKFLKLIYNINNEVLDTKFVSSYDEIPSGTLYMTFSDGLTLKGKVNQYEVFVSTDKEAKNATITLKNLEDSSELAKAQMSFNTVKQLDSYFMINLNKKCDTKFSYIVSDKSLQLKSFTQWDGNTANLNSQFQIDNDFNGIVEFQLNEASYTSTIQQANNHLDLNLKTPHDNYTGKLHFGKTLATYQAIQVELSSESSKNSIDLIRNLNQMKLSAVSDYFNVSTQEVTFVWDTYWKSFSGEGFYTNGEAQRYKFIIQSKSYKDWAFTSYKPDGKTIYANLNVTGRFESKSDFDGVIEGSWEGHKIKFDVKNFFGSYYQTTFNLITPFKGWARTSFDCTLNDQKIGIALAVRNHHMSILARHGGGELLRVEYLGETLLEISSSEGHMTLRTTSYFGKYRFFIQGTQTPGIYVFSILKDGENLISFMLQNYSINDVLHYKGKLIAPEIIPQNSTLSVEFKANTKIWKLLDLKLKKDHRPLLELSWENKKIGEGFDGFLLFQTQIDSLPNFKLKPKVKINAGVDVDLELRYPCEGYGECTFTFAFNPHGLTCHSLSSINALNFHIQSQYIRQHDQISAGFEFNDFKSSNIAINITGKLREFLKFNGYANLFEQKLKTRMDIYQKCIHIELDSNYKNTKRYVLAKSEVKDKYLLLELELPETNLLQMNLSAKGNLSLENGLITLNKNNDNYEILWETNKLSNIFVNFKENGERISDLTFHNSLIQNNSILTDTYLNATYKNLAFEAFMKGFLSDDSVKVNFTLNSPFESLKRLNIKTELEQFTDRVHFQQVFELAEDSFVLNATSKRTRKGHTIQMHYKPFNNQLITKRINVKYINKHTNKSPYDIIFDVNLGDESYIVNYNQMKEGYEAEITRGDIKVAYLKYNKNLFDLKVESFGDIKKFLLKFDNKQLVIASEINNYQNLIFVQPEEAFGIIMRQLSNKNNKRILNSVVTIVKIKEGTLPLLQEYDSNLQNDTVLFVNVFDHNVIFNMNKTNTSLVLKNKHHQFKIFLIDANDSYNLNLRKGNKEIGKFSLRKDLSYLSNDIYIPFEVKISESNFSMDSEMVKLNFGKSHQSISLEFYGNQKIHYEFNFGRNINIIYKGNGDKLVFILKDTSYFEFSLNDLVNLKYDLQDRLLTSFEYKQNEEIIKYSLTANAIRNITFQVSNNDTIKILLQSYFDPNNISYHLRAPKWNLLRLFDLTLSWISDKDSKIFGASLNVESDHIGNTKAGTIFEMQKDLLNIESQFKAPFLEGFETFYGKIYIPKDFRPHVEFILPKQTYKLYFNHSDNYINAEVICRNKKFSLVINNNNRNSVMIEIIVPDERLKSFMYKYTGNRIEINLNDVYSINMTEDWMNLRVETPHKGYEKFGYWFNIKGASFDITENKRQFALGIIHPGYDTPLGVGFQYTLTDNKFDMSSGIHVPFIIEGYDHALLNISSELVNGKIDFKINAWTNNIDIGFDFGVILTKERTFVKGHSHFNEFYYIGEINLESWRVYFILGNPLKEDSNFLETFPDFERFVSDKVIMVYLSLEEENLELLMHNSLQPFSIRRNGYTFGKIIWDLRKPQETLIGVNLKPNIAEIFVLDNKIIFKNDIDMNDSNLSLIFNQHKFLYKSQRNYSSNSTIVIKSLHNLETPYGGIKLIKQMSMAHSRFNNSMEILWGDTQSDTNLSNLLLTYEINPGTLVSTMSSSLLPHDIILNLNMSQFQSIPSIFEASLVYSDIIDKTIYFRMFYNKSYDHNDCVKTYRAFILKHPTSMIDYELYFNAVRMPEFSNGSVILKYKDFDSNEQETMKASMKVDHNRFGINGEIITNRNRLHFTGISTSMAKRYGFLINIEINDKDPLNLECNYDFGHESPSASLMAAYGTSRKYIVYAGLPNEKEITAKLGHEIYGKASLDALAIARLNTSQLLWVKILWKDNLYAPFHEAIVDEYNDLRYVIEATGRQLIDVIHDDVGKELINDFDEIKETIFNYTMEQVNKTLEIVLNPDLQCSDNDSNLFCKVFYENEELRQLGKYLLENLEFLLNTVEKIIQTSFNSIRVLLDAVNEEFKRAMKDIKNIQNIKVDAKAILKKGINTARKSLREMEVIVVKILDDFDKYVSDIQEQVVDFFEPFLSLVDEFIGYCEQRLTILQIAILDTLDSIQQYIFNLREIKAMFSVYYSYINWLEELHVIDMLEPVGDVIEEILETIIKDVKRILDHYKPYLDALSNAIFGKYDGLNQLPPIIEIREHVNRIYHKTIWVWNYHNMTEGLKQCIKKFSRDVDNALSFFEFDELASNEDLDYHFGLNYVIRPENRLIEISQPLPVEWKAFNQSPSFEHYPLYQRIQGKSQQFIRFYRSRYDLIDMLENFVIDLYTPSISPSTRNQAMIIGNSQLLTFNGLRYSIFSNCSYLLASDFKTKSFSLIINYKRNGTAIDKSYEILTNGNSYEIFSEEIVTLNGVKVDLPLVYKQVTITRENKNIIAESSRGFKMICYFHYNYCTIQLSGWLYGKTAGLLGTLDNEQHTDSITSRRVPSPNILEFLRSWELQPQCELLESPQIIQSGKLEYAYHWCSLLFNNSISPLANCFDTIDPEPFCEICYNGFKNEANFNGWTATAAYVHLCKQAKAAIEMPIYGVTCNGNIGYNEEILDGHNNKTVDVVFINELNCYNNTAITSTLPKLLDDDLNRMKFSGNRFASVGYGGYTLPKPHVYTHNGKIWTFSNEMKINLELNERNLNAKSKFTAIDAIKYAANLEYRPGVSKLFILSQCEIATDVSNSPDIYNMLGVKDITLHVLKPSPFNNHTNVIGLSMNKLLPEKNNPDVNHSEIMNQIDDIYSGLALSTNGTIFDLTKVHENADSAALWAQTITKQVKPSPCQKCVCLQDVFGWAKIDCTRCLAPAVKQFLNEYEEGNKMKFNDGDDSE